MNPSPPLAYIAIRVKHLAPEAIRRSGRPAEAVTKNDEVVETLRGRRVTLGKLISATKEGIGALKKHRVLAVSATAHEEGRARGN
jgi:hypothetical protein